MSKMPNNFTHRSLFFTDYKFTVSVAQTVWRTPPLLFRQYKIRKSFKLYSLEFHSQQTNILSVTCWFDKILVCSVTFVILSCF